MRVEVMTEQVVASKSKLEVKEEFTSVLVQQHQVHVEVGKSRQRGSSVGQCGISSTWGSQQRGK